MLPLSQRHKEKSLNKTIPVACMLSSCFNFTKTSGGVRQSWRIPKVLKEFDSEFLSVPVLRLPVLSVQLFAAPAAAQALLSHCWGTGKSCWSFQDPHTQLPSHSLDTNTFHTFRKSSLQSASPSSH